MIRLGVAGLGGMGVVHARNALDVPGALLVAVASARAGPADVMARELEVQACTYAELLDADDVDAVVLAARSIDHARLAGEALARGKHVFLEKPGATTLADHARLRAAAASRSELVVQLGYQRRFDAAFTEARRLVAGGAIGEPHLVLATSRDTEWPPGEHPRETGGFLLDMAVHDYDIACWFLEQEPIEAFAARQALVHPQLAALGDLDNAIVTIRFAGGAVAATHVSRTCAFGHDIRCEVVGREGSVLVGWSASGTVTVLSRGDRERFPQDFRERFGAAYRAELEAFVAACSGDGPPGPGLDGDRHAVAIGVAARASAVGGEPLAVGTDWPWLLAPEQR